MTASVKVVSEAQYRAFLATHSDGSPVVAAEAYVGVCAKCHGMEGQGAYGPPLQGRTFDPTDITHVLRTGVSGSLGRMPAVGSDWSPAQIDAMIAYLQKIHGGPPSGS